MAPIRLVVSDVDGSMVTRDKQLTPAAIAAVAQLHQRGIKFSAVSSRPPFGMRMLVKPLNLDLPLGAFNGSTTFNPDLSIIERHAIPRDAVNVAIDLLTARKVDVWLFTEDTWYIRRPDGPNVEREKRTVAAEPKLIDDLAPVLDHVCKIVGVSDDFELLAGCEPDLKAALGKAAHAARSQNYYLDITPPGYDKGTFVEALANQLKIPLDAVATIGDMTNDLPMFLRSGVSVAMGNASDTVKKRANHVTASNEEDGFAKAIDQILKID
jgi:Cof subfamily protein (haloacid dehalogenase superfamily)